MKDLRQLLHEELDRIFDELSKRVDINNSDIYLDINADEYTEIYTYNHVVVNSALGFRSLQQLGNLRSQLAERRSNT